MLSERIRSVRGRRRGCTECAAARRWRRSLTVSRVFALLLVLLGGILPGQATAQTPSPAWMPAANLSRSGSASEPALVLGENLSAQAFWWDRFDGLMTAHYNGRSWQPATGAGLTVPDFGSSVGPDDTPVLVPIDVMPRLLGDGRGYVHAFWATSDDVYTSGAFASPPGSYLLHSRARIGTTVWSDSTIVASGVLAWHSFSDANGGMHVVYVRSRHTETMPAGLYYARLETSPISWEIAAPAQPRIYARLFSEDDVHLAAAADGAGNVVIAWRDPRLERAFCHRSGDNGQTWTEQPMWLEGADEPALARLGDGRFLGLWQVAIDDNQVAYYQQISEDDGRTWSEPRRVLRDMGSLGGEAALRVDAAGELMLVTGIGGPSLSVAVHHGVVLAGDANADQWSLPHAVAMNIHDAETERTVSLEVLMLASDGQWITLLGLGQDGEVWAARREASSMNWAFDASAPWSNLARVWEGDVYAERSALVVDSTGRLHAFWIAPADGGEMGTTLRYACRDSVGWSPSTVLFDLVQGTDGLSAAASGGRVHLVWSSGAIGSLTYSSASQARAGVASEWDAADAMPMPAEAIGCSAPRLAADVSGRLHVVYSVPWNEARGIYYLQSGDGGGSWSAPSQVFDSAAAGWARVGSPDLVIDVDGVVHVVWAQVSSVGEKSSSVHWARSTDGGATWSVPRTIYGEPCSHPRLALSGLGNIHVLWVGEQDTRQWGHRRSADGGETWTSVGQVVGFGHLQGEPDLVYDGVGAVYLLGVCETESTDFGVRCAVWEPESQAWLSMNDCPADVHRGLTGGVAVALATAQGELHALLPSAAGSGDSGPVLVHAWRDLPPSAERVPVPTAAPTAPSQAVDVAPIGPTALPAEAPTSQSGPAGIRLGPFWLPITGIAGMGVAAVLVVAAILLRPARNNGFWRRRE